MRPSSTFKTLLLPCLLLLALTLPHLEQGDFRRDTGRYAAVGLYMWSGGDLLAPHLGPDVPYFNKPPLAFWVHGFFLRTLGTNLIAARLPSILAALGVLVLSVLTVRKLATNAEAIVSGLVLALTYEFFRRTREISLDFSQLLFVMLAVYFFASGMKEHSRGKIVLSGIGIGFALLCKPFVALGLLPIFALWATLARVKGTLLALLGTTALAIVIAAPWHIYMAMKFPNAFIRQYLFHEVIGRVQGQTGKAPFHYYLVNLVSTYWPWLLAVAYALYVRFQKERPHRRADRDLIVLGGVWILFIGLLISLFPDKSPNYALPLYPMLSWIAAAGLCRLPWLKLREWYAAGFKGLAPASVILLLGLSLAPIRFQEGPNRDWKALFAWMKQNSIALDQLASGELKPNERAYFYIKTGYWLPEFSSVPTNVPAPRWLVTTHDDKRSSPVFTAGIIEVFATSNSRPHE